MEDKAQKNQFLSEIEKNQKIIYKVCHLYTDTDTDFRDLYQEIVLNLWKGYPTFEGRSKISTWIYRVALNTAFYKLRKDKMKVPFNLLSHEHYDIPDFDDEQEQDNLKMLIKFDRPVERS